MAWTLGYVVYIAYQHGLNDGHEEDGVQGSPHLSYVEGSMSGA